MGKEIIIKPSFVFKDYFKIDLYLLFGKTIFLLSTYLMIFSLLITLLIDEIYSFINYFLLFLFAYLFLFFTIYRSTKKKLQNPKLKEDVYIKLNTECVEDIGESFNMKYFWKDIKKVVEKKEWFLIYIEKNTAKVIRKADIKDNQYNELKELFNSLNIKKSLK